MKLFKVKHSNGMEELIMGATKEKAMETATLSKGDKNTVQSCEDVGDMQLREMFLKVNGRVLHNGQLVMTLKNAMAYNGCEFNYRIYGRNHSFTVEDISDGFISLRMDSDCEATATGPA